MFIWNTIRFIVDTSFTWRGVSNRRVALWKSFENVYLIISNRPFLECPKSWHNGSHHSTSMFEFRQYSGGEIIGRWIKINDLVFELKTGARPRYIPSGISRRTRASCKPQSTILFLVFQEFIQSTERSVDDFLSSNLPHEWRFRLFESPM